MRLNEFRPGKTGVAKSKRVGRGIGSGWGTTAGRGQKGAGARKSAKKGRVAFEGGQTPIQRRLPKRGFSSNVQNEMQIVNLKKLENLSADVIDPIVLFDNGCIKRIDKPVKVLAYGSISKPITLKVSAISDTARKAIEAAGGKVEIV
ncbi:MAG: 50S ribosomal protein L15 [Fibrobacter sp.]|nr:50S ribosomal protein L15 [Fibrobacter sp.]